MAFDEKKDLSAGRRLHEVQGGSLVVKREL